MVYYMFGDRTVVVKDVDDLILVILDKDDEIWLKYNASEKAHRI